MWLQCPTTLRAARLRRRAESLFTLIYAENLLSNVESMVTIEGMICATNLTAALIGRPLQYEGPRSG
jgi:hypothetical protein